MVSNREYVNLLHSGCKAQLEKLTENSHKPGFEGDDLAGTYMMLEAEVGELWEAIEMKGLTDIRREAADVANYAHIIIYNCDRLLKEGCIMPSDVAEGV